jgi:hypothetical protein
VDPDPSLDPYVFGPPDPDPALFCIDPDPDRSINKQKKIKKNLDFYLFYFLSMKTDVNVPSKSNKKKLTNKLFLASCQQMTKKAVPGIRIRIRGTERI